MEHEVVSFLFYPRFWSMFFVYFSTLIAFVIFSSFVVLSVSCSGLVVSTCQVMG